MLLTEYDEKAYNMKITDRTIDGGTPFDWGKISAYDDSMRPLVYKDIQKALREIQKL